MRLQHKALDHILWRLRPDDPFDEPGADLVLEDMLNGPLPPEAYKDSDELAAEQLLASVEGFDVPEPPEYPELDLALAV